MKNSVAVVLATILLCHVFKTGLCRDLVGVHNQYLSAGEDGAADAAAAAPEPAAAADALKRKSLSEAASRQLGEDGAAVHSKDLLAPAVAPVVGSVAELSGRKSEPPKTLKASSIPPAADAHSQEDAGGILKRLIETLFG